MEHGAKQNKIGLGAKNKKQIGLGSKQSSWNNNKTKQNKIGVGRKQNKSDGTWNLELGTKQN